MDILIVVVVMLLMLLLKGFFSGSEIALVNVDKIKLRHRAKQGHQGAQLALKMLQSSDVLLSTTLVGTNLSTVALTTLGTMLMLRHLGQAGDVWALVIYTPLFLVLGEIVPKSVYQQKSDFLTPILIYPLLWASYLFYPVIYVFSRVGRVAARLVGAGKTEQPLFITREQLRTVVEMAEQAEAMGAFDRGRIRRVIRFAETTVAEAMIPITEVTAISRTKSTRTAIDLVRRHGYNRLPVYEKSANNITGVATLTTWDLMDRELAERPLESLIRDALYVSPLQTIDQLLPVLRQREDRMAIVVDEFGSAVGMITMEDIVEEVVGEIDVGYDFEEYLPRRKRIFEELEEGVYLMDSRLSVSEANEILGISLPTTEIHTLGGLILSRLRRIPAEGESIVESGYRFTVAEATPRAIVRLRVEPEAPAPARERRKAPWRTASD